MQRLFPALWVVLFLVVSPLHAEPKVYGEQRIHRWWDALTDDISQTWEQPERYDLYLPGWAYLATATRATGARSLP